VGATEDVLIAGAAVVACVEVVAVEVPDDEQPAAISDISKHIDRTGNSFDNNLISFITLSSFLFPWLNDR
jgi:hypothetical protein